MKAVLGGLTRLLLPNVCVCCDAMMERSQPDGLVCGVCQSRMRPVVGGCRRCRQPLPLIGPCRFCAPWPPDMDAAWSGVWLDEPARELVHHLKYEDLPRLGDTAAAIITRFVTPPAGILMPVPLSPRRRRLRGYNQADTIARALARRWDLVMDETVLRRIREGPSQTSLAPEARAANVAGAYAASPGGTAAILVDDVLTTGATLAAAARALAGAGWAPIRAVTFARALPIEMRLVSDA